MRSGLAKGPAECDSDVAVAEREEQNKRNAKARAAARERQVVMIRAEKAKTVATDRFDWEEGVPRRAMVGFAASSPDEFPAEERA